MTKEQQLKYIEDTKQYSLKEVDFAERIYNIINEGMYEVYDYKPYQIFEEINISKSRGYRYLRVYTKFAVTENISKKQMELCGITKLELINKLCVDKKSLKEWLNIAETNSVSDVSKLVKNAKLGGVDMIKCLHENTIEFKKCTTCGEIFRDKYDDK